MKRFWSHFDDFEYKIENFWVHLALKLPIWVEVPHTNVPEPSGGEGGKNTYTPLFHQITVRRRQ